MVEGKPVMKLVHCIHHFHSSFQFSIHDGIIMTTDLSF
jgi:hypothetical protein